ncbi:hypothetical protein PV328_012403, partial [Microctonus aethiopoides]
MARIILILLIFAVVNKQTTSLSFFGIDFNDIQNVYNYVNTLYGKGVSYANKDAIEENSVDNQLKQIMSELKDMSKQLTNFMNHQDEKMDQVMKKLLNDIEVIDDLQSVRTELINNVVEVEFWFNIGLEFEEHSGLANQTYKYFIRNVLWTSNNIEHTLFNIYKLIFPGESTNIRKSFLTLSLDTVQRSYERLCDKYISPQQQLYYIFLHLIRIQLKGFTTITQAYSMQSAFNHVYFIEEYKIFKQTFDQRLTNYVESFLHFMAEMPADIRRCEVQYPVI